MGPSCIYRLVQKTSSPFPVSGENLAVLLRRIFAASVRTKIDFDPEFAARMMSAESEMINKYRLRTEEDRTTGVRYAVFPLCAIILTD